MTDSYPIPDFLRRQPEQAAGPRERPILFSAPMVRAILAGTKTQTRRAVKPQPPEFDHATRQHQRILVPRCPYGQPADRLYVREAFRFLDSFDEDSPATVGERCLAAGYPKPWAPTQYEADGWRDNWMQVGTPRSSPGSATAGKLRPGIHMPRWASRITLEITGVRVERLHEISEADALAEGVNVHPDHHGKPRGSIYSPVQAYRDLWESINGPDAWAVNPWVWVVEFRRVVP
jgi:hypothetical protein